MIRVEEVWKSYGGRAVLRGATLRVDEGEAVLLTGPSGCGKSALLRLLCLLERPDRGDVLLAGRSLGRLQASSVPYVRRNLGVVLQEPRLLSRRTVYQNVAVALEVLGLPQDEERERALAALTALGLLADADQPAGGLPAGVRQRVALARALCADPPVLLCDEPTANLDPARADEVLALLFQVHQRGTTLLLASHDPQVVAACAARGFRKALMRDGEVVAGAQPAQALLTDLPDDEADDADDADAIDAPESAPALAPTAPQLGPRPPALPTLKLARAVPPLVTPMVTITSQRDRDRSLEVSIEVTAPDEDGREGRP